jgi:hypothetical protein
MRTETMAEFTAPDKLKEEIRLLRAGRGRSEVELQVSYEPQPSPYPDEDFYTGDLRIRARGQYVNPQGELFQKQVLAVYGVTGMYLGIVAPDHALFIREKEHLNYNFEDSVMPSSLSIYNGDVYIKEGMTAELSDYNKRRMIEKGELTWEEYYYMDHPPSSYGLYAGGIDFLDSNNVEYENNGIFRKFNIFGTPVKQVYSRNVSPIHGFYTDQRIKLRTPEFYKEIAKIKIEPRIYSHQGSINDNGHFRDVIFEGENGYNSVRYNKVLPLYGYGDWRHAPLFDPDRYGERSRKHDMKNAINIDGVAFIRGDVFIEGWFEGLGLLVVQGNVYLGGSLRALSSDYIGYPSLLNIIVFEDSAREGGYTASDHDSFKKTGQLIVKPHADNDWSEVGGADPDPMVTLHAAVYAQNGMKVDKEAWRDNWAVLGKIEADLKHNFVTETVNMNFIPHELIINGKNPDDEFREFAGMSLKEFLQPEINTVMKTWIVETIGEPEVSLES